MSGEKPERGTLHSMLPKDRDITEAELYDYGEKREAADHFNRLKVHMEGALKDEIVAFGTETRDDEAVVRHLSRIDNLEALNAATWEAESLARHLSGIMERTGMIKNNTTGEWERKKY